MKKGEIWESKSNPKLAIRLDSFDRKTKIWRFHYVDIYDDGSMIFNLVIYEEIKSNKIIKLYKKIKK